MALDLRKNGEGFKELMDHVGHKIAVVYYAPPAKNGKPDINSPTNVAIECEDCNCVLLDFDRPEGYDRLTERRKNLQHFS